MCFFHSHVEKEINIKCKGNHDQHFGVAYEFKSVEEAEKFIYMTEIDSEFSITHSHYSEAKFYRRYACACSGVYEAVKSTKKNINCSAGFSLIGMKNDDGSDTFLLFGCVRQVKLDQGIKVVDIEKYFSLQYIISPSIFKCSYPL